MRFCEHSAQNKIEKYLEKYLSDPKIHRFEILASQPYDLSIPSAHTILTYKCAPEIARSILLSMHTYIKNGMTKSPIYSLLSAIRP